MKLFYKSSESVGIQGMGNSRPLDFSPGSLDPSQSRLQSLALPEDVYQENVNRFYTAEEDSVHDQKQPIGKYHSSGSSGLGVGHRCKRSYGSNPRVFRRGKLQSD
jgi:hypothetical protein